MPPTIDDVQVLLIQARDTRDMERQEQQCFLERCQLRADQLRAANVVRDPITPDLLDGADALMVGGAGEYSARLDYPWMDDVLQLLHRAEARYLPTFGSCWGHQLIARAFGGHVVHDGARAEFGCGAVSLTEAGQDDVLFGDFPAQFRANMGHHDRVDVLPDGAVELAYNDSQRNQAFRLAGKPIYGTQFHSELDARRERERLLAYRDLYREQLGTEADFQRIMNSLAETTEVDGLLRAFLECFVVREAPVED